MYMPALILLDTNTCGFFHEPVNAACVCLTHHHTVPRGFLHFGHLECSGTSGLVQILLSLDVHAVLNFPCFVPSV